jgi:hypothetical protein
MVLLACNCFCRFVPKPNQCALPYGSGALVFLLRFSTLTICKQKDYLSIVKCTIMSDEKNKQHRPESYPKPTEMDAALKQQDEYATLKPNEQGTITGVSQLDNPGEDNAANQEDVAETFENYRKNSEGS